jgi:hypothetical protein
LLCKGPTSSRSSAVSTGSRAMTNQTSNDGIAEPEQLAPYVDGTTPENQAATFRNQDQLWHTRVIRRGDAVRPLLQHARSLEDLAFESGGARVSLSDYMARRRTAGLLILKHGEIALERYGKGNGPESRWTSFSTAKSMTVTLIGAALHDERSAAWTIAATSICHGCAAQPMRASRSSMSCGCARAWPGASRTLPKDDPRSIACSEPFGAGGLAPSWISCANWRALIRRVSSSTIRPVRAVCLARWSRPPRAGRWLITSPRRSGGLPTWRPTGTGSSSPRAAWSWAGLASARACATSAASANWCWRTAKRLVADGPAARLARSRRPARQRSHRLRSAGAGRPRGIRLPLVGGSSPAGRRE